MGLSALSLLCEDIPEGGGAASLAQVLFGVGGVRIMRATYVLVLRARRRAE